jgi:hypothetical protein
MHPRGDAIFRFNPELGFAVVMQPPYSGSCSPYVSNQRKGRTKLITTLKEMFLHGLKPRKTLYFQQLTALERTASLSAKVVGLGDRAWGTDGS